MTSGDGAADRYEVDDPSAHYDRLAEKYDGNWEYSEEFLSWMTDSIERHLAPQPGDTVIDVGGGTGIYARRLAERLGPDPPVLCIDPSPAMLAQVPRDMGVVTIQADADGVAAALGDRGVRQVHRILIKEAVHHFPDPARSLRGLARLLAPGGQMLVVMLPPTIDYPLFDAALRRYEALQPHFAAISDALSDAGLSTTVTEDAFHLSINVDHYLGMVANRYMSLLSTLTDEELMAGLEEMRVQSKGRDVYQFDDRFVFVSGRTDGE